MKKQTTQQKKARLRRKADRLYQKIGREVYEKKGCLICRGKYSCLHHYIGKDLCFALRYDLENGVPVCHSCHMGIEFRKDPWYNNQIIRKKGQEWADKLESKRRKKVNYTLEYMKNIIILLNSITK